MKMTIKVAILMTVLAASGSVCAAEWHVYSEPINGMTGVQQLTNAFARAVSGDTITIHAGTYHMTDIGEIMDKYYTAADQTEYGEDGTCYYTLTPNLTVQGDPAVTADQIVLSGAGSSAGNYGKLRVMHLGGENCTVRNLTFLRGNGNFTRYVNGTSQGWNYRRGGGLFLTKGTSSVIGCIFESCYAQQGAAVAGGTVASCKFRNCIGKQTVWQPMGVTGCEFENAATAIIASRGPISDCTFTSCSEESSGVGVIANCADQAVNRCAFVNCTAICLKGQTATVSDCEFTGTKQFLDNCAKVVNCNFKSNGTTWTGSETTDVTLVNGCGLENCRFEGFSIHWGSVVTDPVYMRNCLITGSVCWGRDSGNTFAFTSAFQGSCEIVNCTVVTNQANMMIRKHADSTGSITLRNTLFSNNYVGGQTWGYCDFWNNDLSNITFYNCKVKAAWKDEGSSVTSQDLSGNTENLWGQAFDPRFAYDDKADSLWTLRRGSPCVNAGMNEEWMLAANDLAGKTRIFGGIVDIGCYEYINRFGFCAIVR